MVLCGFDTDVRQVLADEMRKRGVDLRFQADVSRIEKTPHGIKATLNDKSELEADIIMYATGRLPNSKGLGLEAAGVETDEIGAVCVDVYSQTNIPHIYAVGDVTNRLNLTPMAIAEGHAVAETLFKICLLYTSPSPRDS